MSTVPVKKLITFRMSYYIHNGHCAAEKTEGFESAKEHKEAFHWKVSIEKL